MSNTQVDKKYGNDWAKSKSRDLVRGMIQRNLGYKKPKDLRVLCFPGNEAVEVREVYDVLGIPRGNIVGVEREREVADKIRAQNLGIQVINQSLDDYIASQSSLDFDVVSLDYSGPLNQGDLESMIKIKNKQIKSKYVVHHSNLAKRDGDNVDLYIPMGRVAINIGTQNLPQDVDKLIEGTLDSLHRGDLTGDESIKAYRPLVYSMLFRNIFMGTNIMDNGEAERIRTFILSHFSEKERTQYTGCPISEFLSVHRIRLLPRIFMRQGVKDRLLNHVLAMACCYPNNSSVLGIVDSKMYSYISESGDPMLGDIYFLEHKTKFESWLGNIKKQIGFSNRLVIKNRALLENIIRGTLQDFSDVVFSFMHAADRSKEREFLGSSARPVLTKAKAIEEFSAGATVDQVRDKYRGVNGKPITQWKAHVTMGTYDNSRTAQSNEELIVEDSDDSDVEKITKEQAIDLLSNGIPPKEIFEAYPTSFTKGQLAAFKAWITMRSKGN